MTVIVTVVVMQAVSQSHRTHYNQPIRVEKRQPKTKNVIHAKGRKKCNQCQHGKTCRQHQSAGKYVTENKAQPPCYKQSTENRSNGVNNLETTECG